MTKSVFIATTEPYSGKSMVALGLVNMLLGKAYKVAFFKPMINALPGEKKDKDIEMIIDHFGLSTPYEDTYAFTRQEAMQKLEAAEISSLIDTVIHKVKKLEEEYDFTVIEGSDFVGEGAAFEFETNITIAKNLAAPVILVVSGAYKSAADIVSTVHTAFRNFWARDVKVLAIVANRVQKDHVEQVQRSLRQGVGKNLTVAVIPEDDELKNPTMAEIRDQLDAKLITGAWQINNQVDHIVTGAMQLPGFLNYIKENVLIITPGDRGDILVGAVAANQSTNYPRISGVVLTVGLQPEEAIIKLLQGLPESFPVMIVPTGTFETSTAIGGIKSRLTVGNKKKINRAISRFEEYINVEALEKQLNLYQPEGMTPHMFQYQLVKRARSSKKHIVLPEGNDDRILIASARLLNQDIVKLTILGDPEKVAASFNRLGIDITGKNMTIIDPVKSDLYADYVETLYELRKEKNVTRDMAADMMLDVSYFGTMMVYKGHADGMVSGAAHTTQHTIRPALQFVKTKPGIKTVSSVFFMCLPDRVSVFGDCAVNPDPTAEQLAEIAISSAESSRDFGIEPKVAMLSYSSGSSGAGADVEKVREATAIVKSLRPDLKIEGPIQYDAAVDPVVGQQKIPGSEVAGQASVLIFPDLNTGNNTYKAVQRETGALAIGPMLQGLNKPINDLSRGTTVEDIFNTVVITAIQAQDANNS